MIETGIYDMSKRILNQTKMSVDDYIDDVSSDKILKVTLEFSIVIVLRKHKEIFYKHFADMAFDRP